MKWKGSKPFPWTRDELNRIFRAMFDLQTSGGWVKNWKDIRDFINPWIGCFQEDNYNNGERQDYNLLNTSPHLANNIQAAGMQDGITSPYRPWMRLNIKNAPINDEEIKNWCDEVSSIILDILNKTDFYDSSLQYYEELGSTGTAAMLVEEDPDKLIWFRTFTIGEYAIGTTKRGTIDRFARNIKKSYKELVDEFGIDNCPISVQEAYRNNNYDGHCEVKHLVLPNPNYKETLNKKKAALAYAKPFLSLYWANDSQEDEYLRIDGYNKFQFLVCRWSTKGSEIYGRGPGWYAIGDAINLQDREEAKALAIKKKVAPPVLIDSSAFPNSLNTLPDGENRYTPRQGSSLAVTPLYNLDYDINAAGAEIQEIENRINTHFFVDLFKTLANIDREVSATEVNERVKEKMVMIGPVLNRVQHEFLQPLIEILFDILFRNGMLPEPPDSIKELSGQDILSVEYVSNMAQAQKMQGTNNIVSVLTFTESMMEAFPSVRDLINSDNAVRNYSDMVGAPASLLNSDEVVQANRKEQAKQQQIAQAAEMANSASQTAKNLGTTPMGTGSVMDALLPGGGAGGSQ